MAFYKACLLVSCMLSCAFTCMARAQADIKLAQITIGVFDCKSNSAPPRLLVVDIDRKFAGASVSPRWLAGPSSWQTIVSIPAGHYIISAHSDPCESETEQLLALPGMMRHVTLTLNKQVMRGPRATTLPATLPTLPADPHFSRNERRRAEMAGALDGAS